MAASCRKLVISWKSACFQPRISAIGILRLDRCNSMFTAAFASCGSGFNKVELQYEGIKLSGVSCVRTRSRTRSAHGLSSYTPKLRNRSCLQKLDNETCCKGLRTSTFYFNNRESEKGEKKRNVKERLEKVKEMREDILTIPNILSASRIIAAPFLAYFIISDEFIKAVLLFGVAGITDMLDGYIARNFKNQQSVFGTVLDPMADKILMSVLTISLTVAGLLPIPLTVLIISRDVLLIGASFYFRYRSLPPPKTISRYFDVNLATVELRPNLLGKANTVLQLGLVGCTLLAPVCGFVGHPYLQGLWVTVAASTVLSSLSYVFSAKTAVRYLR